MSRTGQRSAVPFPHGDNECLSPCHHLFPLVFSNPESLPISNFLKDVICRMEKFLSNDTDLFIDKVGRAVIVTKQKS